MLDKLSMYLSICCLSFSDTDTCLVTDELNCCIMCRVRGWSRHRGDLYSLQEAARRLEAAELSPHPAPHAVTGRRMPPRRYVRLQHGRGAKYVHRLTTVQAREMTIYVISALKCAIFCCQLQLLYKGA